MEGYELGRPEPPPDVVIHFGAFARSTSLRSCSFLINSILTFAIDMLVPDNECFQANTMSTYNVIEAASKLGVKKIIIASSETASEPR